ncbi:hypothetical protein FQZ97_723840 [compost metagenome]
MAPVAPLVLHAVQRLAVGEDGAGIEQPHTVRRLGRPGQFTAKAALAIAPEIAVVRRCFVEVAVVEHRIRGDLGLEHRHFEFFVEGNAEAEVVALGDCQPLGQGRPVHWMHRVDHVDAHPEDLQGGLLALPCAQQLRATLPGGVEVLATRHDNMRAFLAGAGRHEEHPGFPGGAQGGRAALVPQLGARRACLGQQVTQAHVSGLSARLESTPEIRRVRPRSPGPHDGPRGGPHAGSFRRFARQIERSAGQPLSIDRRASLFALRFRDRATPAIPAALS